jgi:hypothetical protein
MTDPSAAGPSVPGAMDWNEILDKQEKDPGFKPAPADKYRLRVDKAEGIKASTGKDMVKLTCKIIGGPYDTKLVWTNIVFTNDNPNAVRFTLRKLAALGISEEALRANNPSKEQIAAMVQGVEFEGEVIINDQDNNDIKSFRSLLPGGASVPTPSVPSAPTVPPAPTIPTPTIPDAPSAEAPAAPAEGAPKEPF